MAESDSEANAVLPPSRLLTQAGTVSSARVVGAGLSYIVQILFARWAGPEQYGVYSYVMAWTALLSTLSGLGFPQSVVRFIPEYQSERRWGALRGIIKKSEQVVGGTAGATTVLAVGFVLLASLYDPTPLYTVPLILGFIFIAPRTLLKLQTKMCVARQQMRLAYVLLNLSRPTVMLGGAAALVLGFHVSLTGSLAVLVASAPIIPMWFSQRWGFRRNMPDPSHDATAEYSTKEWLRTSLPMFLITGFLVFLSRTDVIMIGLMSDASDVGVYRVATKTASLVLFPLFAINTVVTPRFSEYYAQDNGEALQRLASTAATWMFLSALLVGLGLIATSDFILALFGPSFPQAKAVLLILICGQVVNAGAGSVGSLLTMTGYQNEASVVYGTCALFNVGLNAGGSTFSVSRVQLSQRPSVLCSGTGASIGLFFKNGTFFPRFWTVFEHLNP